MNIQATTLKCMRIGSYAHTAAAATAVLASLVCVIMAYHNVPASRIVTMLQYRPVYTVSVAVYKVAPSVGRLLLSRTPRNASASQDRDRLHKKTCTHRMC
jgi:hypothetical protein